MQVTFQIEAEAPVVLHNTTYPGHRHERSPALVRLTDKRAAGVEAATAS